MDENKIFVFDLECTCWRGRPPLGMRQEIIEIGCCLFDRKTGEITQRRSLIIRPSSSTISDFCTELTSITQSLIDKEGMDFREACNILTDEYSSNNVASSAWGRFDSKQLKSDCRMAGISYPLSDKHINLQRRFSTHSGLKNEMSVANALKYIGKQFDGVQHRAVDDAYNTAVLLSHIMSTEPVRINGHH